MNAMTHAEQVALGIDSEEICTNPNGGPEFVDIAKVRLDRRGFLRTTSGGAAVAAIGSVGLTACGGGGDSAPVVAPAPAAPPRVAALTFPAVNKSREDRLSVPTDHTVRPIFLTGDPIAAGIPAFTNLGTDAPATYSSRSGDQHDGIEYFGLNNNGTAADPINGNSRGILGMNHETVVASFLHPAGTTAATFSTTAVGGTSANNAVLTARPQSEVDREVAMHGVSIVEVRRTDAAGNVASTGTWNYVSNSPLNRRITAATAIEISGPLRGNASMVTKFSPTGTQTRGTINNCGTGYSFWGTLLTNEENWAGYAWRDQTVDNVARGGATANAVISFNRYGIGTAATRNNFNNDRFGWASLAATTAAGMAANAVGSVGDLNDRWNANIVAASASLDYRNVMNTFGWVVEIDPYNPAATPRKRTAMGRFAHEAAVMNAPVAGQPIAIYMGDDNRGDYIYKFVSTAVWDPADAAASLNLATNRMALGDKYLDAGTLYAARFNANGTGTWLPLTFANPVVASYTPYRFADAADVAANSRIAGDAVGATRMDRPEWGSVNALTRDIYFTMTENNASAFSATTGQTGRRADNIDGANPRFYVDARDATTSTTAGTNSGNTFGHIVRFREDALNPASLTFTWDVYLFGSQADADPQRVNLSGLTTDNDFARCDGMWFSRATNVCWIQTDDSGGFTDQSNAMMLAALPGSVNDGVANPGVAASTATVGSTPAGAVLAPTRVGAPVTTATLRRFLVGPRDAEITGVTDTPDGRTMFVNIQHPGEDTANANLVPPAGSTGAGNFNSYWPTAERAPGSTANVNGARPRSGTVVITRNNGGQVGA
ncbi:MAG: PhoX family protein [Burkholderiales bacterium]